MTWRRTKRNLLAQASRETTLPTSGDTKGLKRKQHKQELKKKTTIDVITGLEKVRKSIRSFLKRPLTKHQKHVLILMVLVAIALIGLTIVFWQPLKNFLADPAIFKRWFEQDPIIAVLAFLGMMVLQIVIAFIPGEPLQLAAGYGFGFIGGTILCVVGAIIGSTIVFLMVKRFGVALLHVFFSEDDLKALTLFNDPKRRNTITFILMFIPGTPKDLFTYLLPLTPMNLWTWLAISIPARLLGIVGSTIIGSQFANQNHAVAIGVSIIAVIASLLGILYYRNLSKKQAASRERIERYSLEQLEQAKQPAQTEQQEQPARP